MDRWLGLGLVILLASSIGVAVFVTKPAGEKPTSETPSGENLYPAYSAWPSYVSISADGNYIAAVYSERGDVLLFSRSDNTPLWRSTVEGTYGSGKDITESVAISENGNYIAVGGRGNTYLFSKDNATPLWSANAGGADGTQISGDGNYIAALYGGIRFFSKDNNEPLRSLGGGSSFALASDGSRLAVAGVDKIYLFGPENNTPLWSFDASENLRSTVTSISSGGSYVVVDGGNGKLYLFGREDNVPQWIYHSAKYLNPAISADGNYIAAGHDAIPERNEGNLYLFSRADNNPLWATTCPPRPKVVISANGEYIAVGGERSVEFVVSAPVHGELYFFSRASSTPLWTYQFPTHIYVKSVSMSADGQYIAVGTGGQPAANVATSIYLFSKNSNQPLWVYYHEVEPYVPT